MAESGKQTDAADLVAETRAIWDAMAAFWDARMGEGNAFQRDPIGPATGRLLAVRPGELVLDLACGNGVFARRLARLGARAVATDFSARFLDPVRARTSDRADRIDYRLVDAADEAQLLAPGEGRFDAAVCTMALMDMPIVDPLPRALARLLAPGGRFVFSVQHPAFNSNGVSLGAETADRGGNPVETTYVRGENDLRAPPRKGAGMPGEPEPHWCFHRSLEALFGACFAAGFAIDGLEEPSFGPGRAVPGLSWFNCPDIPPVLVARARPARPSDELPEAAEP